MKKFGIRSELNAWIFAFLAIFSVAQLICLLYLSVSNNSKNKEIVENVASYINSSVETKLDNVDSIRKSLLANEKLKTLLSDDNMSVVAEARSQLLRDVYTIQTVSKDIIYVMVVDNVGKVYNLTTSISTDEANEIVKVFNEYTVRNNGMTDGFDFFDMASVSANHLYICNFEEINTFDFENYTTKSLGTLIVCAKVDVRNFFQFSAYKNMVELRLTSAHRNVDLVPISNSHKIGERLKVETNKVDPDIWTISGYVYLGEDNSIGHQFRIVILIELFSIILLGIIWQFMLSKRFSKPLRKIMDYLNGWNVVEKTQPLSVKGNSDVETFAANVNEVLARNKDLARDLVKNQQILYDAEIAKKEALIYALQNQVNPHFLYNILELIRSIAVVYDVSEIEIISVNLAEIFRYNLNNNLYVTLRDEVEIAKKYIALAHERFGSVFDVSFDIPQELLDNSIIKMVFQPILENAFNHGLGDFDRQFEIVIKAVAVEEGIELSISDNGLGIDENKLTELNESFINNHTLSSRGIGLANLNNRLGLAYGPNARINIYSQKDHYTKVVILIPRDK